MSEPMTEVEAVAYLKKNFHIRTFNRGLILLNSLKAMLGRAGDEERKELGLIIVGLAAIHKLTDKQLLTFFDTTMEEVQKFNSASEIETHGLYRILVTCPFLSKTCELFFDGWLAASYEENPFKCQLRRVGVDAFRIVSILPDGKEVELKHDVSMDQTAEYTNCSKETLLSMPVLQ